MNEDLSKEEAKAEFIEEMKAAMTPEKIGRKIARGVAKYGVGFVTATFAKK